LRAAYQIEFRYTLFPLHPDTPDEGLSLQQLFAGRSFDIDAMQTRLATLMADEGLPFSERTMTYNSRLAQELSKWAEAEGKGDEFHNAVFRAYFVEGMNIAKADVLVGLSESIGLSGDEARRVVQERTFREEVAADWTRSRVLGITAVPTVIMGARGIAGFQPYEVLEQFLKSCGVEKTT
jgi:predicted DsbA family dithiol-disulfide isomerase